MLTYFRDRVTHKMTFTAKVCPDCIDKKVKADQAMRQELLDCKKYPDKDSRWYYSQWEHEMDRQADERWLMDRSCDD